MAVGGKRYSNSRDLLRSNGDPIFIEISPPLSVTTGRTHLPHACAYRISPAILFDQLPPHAPFRRRFINPRLLGWGSSITNSASARVLNHFYLPDRLRIGRNERHVYLPLPTRHRNIDESPRICDSLLRSALGRLLLLLRFNLIPTTKLSQSNDFSRQAGWKEMLRACRGGVSLSCG